MCSFVNIITTDSFALLYGKSNLNSSQKYLPILQSRQIIVYLSSSNKICLVSNEPKHISLRFALNRSELTPIVPVPTFICFLHPPFPCYLPLPRLQLSWQCRQNFTNDYRLLALPPDPRPASQLASHASSHPHTTLELTHSCAS